MNIFKQIKEKQTLHVFLHVACGNVAILHKQTDQDFR